MFTLSQIEVNISASYGLNEGFNAQPCMQPKWPVSHTHVVCECEKKYTEMLKYLR